jgi:hypothetical protein
VRILDDRCHHLGERLTEGARAGRFGPTHVAREDHTGDFSDCSIRSRGCQPAKEVALNPRGGLVERDLFAVVPRRRQS